MERIFEWFSLLIGGIVGWVVGKFEPAFPLIIIATLFVLYDAWSAYELDKRVHIMHPQKTKRTQAKFVSYKFRNVIPTLIERFVIIILAYCVERWVFVHIDVPVSYIAAGVVCALLGAGWNIFYPINKALWSSSFVLAVAGYSLIMFALFYYIIDVRGWRKWDFYFKVIGMNSILIYMAPRFIDFSKLNHRLFDGVFSLLPEQYNTVADTIGYMLVLWLFMYFMYRQKIFLKV